MTDQQVRSKTWREWICKVWEVDPLRCPNCDGEIKVIAVNQDKAVVCRILEHLDLWQIRRVNERGTAPQGVEPGEPQ